MVYNVLTQIIVRLGKLRQRCVKDICLRIDRDEINKLPRAQILLRETGFELECCDCGLAHKLRNWDGCSDLHCTPFRPAHFVYKD